MPSDNRARASRTQARERKARRHAQLDALARGDHHAIARFRYGAASLPDDADGRHCLRALLGIGLPAVQAREIAPWSRGGELDHLIDEVKRDRRPFDARRRGEIIGFEMEELKAMKRAGYSVRHVEPFDADDGDVDRPRAAEKKTAERERKRKERAEPSAPSLSRRAQIVLDALGPSRFVGAIMDRVKGPSLRGARGRRLKRHALRIAVGRALDELEALGLAESKIDLNSRGQAARFAALRSHEKTKKERLHTCEASRNLSDDVATRMTDEEQINPEYRIADNMRMASEPIVEFALGFVNALLPRSPSSAFSSG